MTQCHLGRPIHGSLNEVTAALAPAAMPTPFNCHDDIFSGLQQSTDSGQPLSVRCLAGLPCLAKSITIHLWSDSFSRHLKAQRPSLRPDVLEDVRAEACSWLHPGRASHLPCRGEEGQQRDTPPVMLLMLPHLCVERMVHIQLVPSCRPLHAPQYHVMV